MGSPFDSGKTLVFKSISTSGSKRYLNSSPGVARPRSVFLGDSIDFSTHPGCHWESIKLDDGSYRFKSVSISSDRRYLDSSSAAPKQGSVFLKDGSAGGGSHWTPTQLSDGSYSLQTQTPSGPKRFMNSNPASNTREDSIYLVQNSDPIGTHWMVGVDYYTGAEVERIVHGVYAGVAINFYQSDPKYGSLVYDLLHSIWNDSNVGDYQWTQHKFDCDDFAICLKGAVSKYSYNQRLPDDKGSLCGIMWGRNARGAHAFNFTIDPFENLILFEPQNGQQIAHDQFTPYFCIV